MIKIIRRNKYSLELYFDLTGVQQLVNVLERVLKSEELLLELESDSTFTKTKKN